MGLYRQHRKFVYSINNRIVLFPIPLFKKGVDMQKGSKMTKEQKKRVSEGRKGKNMGYRDPSIGRKISAAKKGVPVPEERKERIRKTLTGRKNSEHSRKMKEKYANGDLIPWNKGGFPEEYIGKIDF
jgi:hypothetical protein